MKSKTKKSFFPKDKPKSWVVGVSSGLVALLVASPIMFIGLYIEIKFIESLGKLIFFACWVIFAGSWSIFIVGLLSGKYRGITEQKWDQQRW